MIEWIKITPETEFPKEPFLMTDGENFNVFYYAKENSNFFSVTGNCSDFPSSIEEFTHYAIINLPTDQFVEIYITLVDFIIVCDIL